MRDLSDIVLLNGKLGMVEATRLLQLAESIAAMLNRYPDHERQVRTMEAIRRCASGWIQNSR
jgi:hypothetical protein